MARRRNMSVDQIKRAVDAGKVVCWGSPDYIVEKDGEGGYQVGHVRDRFTVILTHPDGGLNGPGLYYIAGGGEP